MMTREEAIDVVRNIYQTDKEKEALGILIPELKESEDDGIREYILRACEEIIECGGKGLELSMDTTKKLAAYLEKQKEQKSIEHSEEDERIRKTMIRYFTEIKNYGHSPSPSYNDCLAYLERQKVEYGYNKGRLDALKDLPRWRKWGNGACGNGSGIPMAIVKRGINGYELVDALGIPGEQYIMLSDLEKLPGFKED